MDSRLETLFRHIPRHAESADTRLGIRRDEKQDQGGRRGGDGAPDEEKAPDMDRMSVSTATLILFLENLIGAGAPGPAVSVSVSDDAPAAPLTPNARAAQAYQAADRGGRPAPPAAPAGGGAAEGAITLTAEETRQAHALIAQLRALTARGVEALDIEWQGGFLQSVARAAALAAGGA